jgi:hypothetical protein
MNERTIKKLLSGAECIDIICYEFRQALQRDCSLAPHQSYAGLSYRIVCMIDYQTTGDLTHTEVRTQKVERTIDPALPVAQTGVETAGKTKAPNEARKGAGLPIPMATMGEDGKVVEQWVSYKDADR